jgi:hypothetical protein
MTTGTTQTSAAPSQALSILSLVAGVVSIAFGQTFFLPIAAIVLGFIGRGREPQARTLSTIGIILGFLMLLGWILVVIFGAAFLLPLALLHHLS